MQYTHNELKRKIQELTHHNWLGMIFTVNPGIARLLSVLNREDDELIMCEYHLFSNMGVGDLFLTSTRLIFLEGAGLLHKDFEIYLSNIASFERSQGFNKLFAVKITDNGGQKYEFKNLKQHSAEIIIKYCQKIKETQNGNHLQSSNGADEIKKYADLLNQGLITQEEYDKKKAQILGF